MKTFYEKEIERIRECYRETPKKAEAQIKHYLAHGWWSEALWGIDTYISRHYLPILKEFKKKHVGYPGEFNSPEEWDVVLDKIIWSFKQLAAPGETIEQKQLQTFLEAHILKSSKTIDAQGKWIGNIWDSKENKDNYYSLLERHELEIQKGCELFGKYLQNLWD